MSKNSAHKADYQRKHRQFTPCPYTVRTVSRHKIGDPQFGVEQLEQAA
jgi:hypothetical protein